MTLVKLIYAPIQNDHNAQQKHLYMNGQDSDQWKFSLSIMGHSLRPSDHSRLATSEPNTPTSLVIDPVLGEARQFAKERYLRLKSALIVNIEKASFQIIGTNHTSTTLTLEHLS